MKATIHQPYFIPWLGYFSKLVFSDYLVILDNVNFSKRHYLDRTRIVNMHGQISWLNLPVGENFHKNIKDVHVNLPEKDYVNKIFRTIELSYARAKFFKSEYPNLRESLSQPLASTSNLAVINIEIIKNIMKLLNLEMPRIYLESEFDEIYSDATNRIINISKKIKTNDIIIGGGKSWVVHDWQKVCDAGINIYQQDYLTKHPKYPQVRRKRVGFQPGLSVVDALLNVGCSKVREFLTSEIFRPQVLHPKEE